MTPDAIFGSDTVDISLPKRRGQHAVAVSCLQTLYLPHDQSFDRDKITVWLKISRLVNARPGSWVQEGRRNPTFVGIALVVFWLWQLWRPD